MMMATALARCGRSRCFSPSLNSTHLARPAGWVRRAKHDKAGTGAGHEKERAFNVNTSYAVGALAVFIFGLSYASVPLYKVFCQVTGFGGTTQRADDLKSTLVRPVAGAKIVRVDFTCNVHSTMPWEFRPTQKSVKVVPGETALAFYTVRNPTDRAITGIATYNVFPPKAGLYFNKIQCFCFEEQRLGPGEEIDMPVFFFIDPEFVEDPAMESCRIVTLSYTFFKTGEEEPDEEEMERYLELKEQENQKKQQKQAAAAPAAIPAAAATTATPKSA